MLKTGEYALLYKAILAIKSEEECRALLEDLFTINELNAAEQRLEVAELLYKKHTCWAIAEKTGASTTTVSRVNKCLNHGAGGYKTILERISEN